jgi:hypothetical protein
MKDDIYKLIKQTLSDLSKNRPQLNFDSESGQQLIADTLYDNIVNTTVTLNDGTYNEDQLELFTNMEDQEHK